MPSIAKTAKVGLAKQAKILSDPHFIVNLLLSILVFTAIGPAVNGEPTGGELFGSLQGELRFPIWGLLYGALFSDRAGVWFDDQERDLDDVRWSVGAGLRVYTPAGAFVMDVGWNPSREEDEDPVEFHLSIGFPF